ncbi:MAG: S41 family peptidase [Thermoguttaceae bacterium]|nr:S41 family peptidase [Thermoguttaceae bacterium]
MMRRLPGLLLILSLFLGLGVVPAAADQTEKSPAKAADEEDVYKLQKLLVDTIDEVERNYVKDISRRELIEAAIRGVLRELDPYSSYIDPREMRQFRTSVESEFGGIGIQIAVDEGQLKVLSPLVGTPAYRQGILAGDRIVAIDDQPTESLSIDDAIQRLKGKEGTSVTLTVIHPNKTEPEKITVTREVIHVQTVLGDHRKADDSWDYMLDAKKRIGYVRLTGFSRNTAAELRQALKQLKEQDLKGLILDLRFNPGGLLSSAIEICDMFIAEGRIVSTKGRNTPERVWDAKKDGTYEGFAMVVLVNRFSASASEIVAACLQDHKRAVIIGERTWGKGSVQNVIELERGENDSAAGSALKLTTASYHRPSGKNIHRFPGADEDDEWGVTPDEGFQLKLSDIDLVRLVEDRRKRDVISPHSPSKAEPDKTAAETEPAAAQIAADQPADEPADGDKEVKAEKPVDEEKAEKPAWVDAQLQMAIDRLGSELAQAK